MSTASRPQLHIGDHGKDQDDEVAAVLTAALHRAGTIEHRGTIANLHPALDRARLALGTYRSVRHDCAVAMGTSCGSTEEPKPYEFAAPYMTPEHAVRKTGNELFHEVTQQHADTGIDLVLMSGMTDAAELLRAHTELFRQNVASVTLMSSVEARRDAQRHLVPDHTANNGFDHAAATWLYTRLQELRIPLTIVTRNAAMAAAFPASFYDSLAATRHPVGVRLATVQARAIQGLWEMCNDERRQPWGPKDNPRTPQWFRDTFCNGGGEGLTGQDSIWPAVTRLAQYDSLAVIASVPELRERFFQPVKIRERGIVHRVIGRSATQHGVKDADGLRAFILEHCQALLQQTATTNHITRTAANK